jgi:rRNA maturation endonuclease Nob1
MHIAYQKTYSNNPVEEIKEHILKCDRCGIYNQSASILCKYCAKAIAIYYNIEDSNEQEILNRYNP